MKFDVVTLGDLVADMLLPIERLPVSANDVQLTYQMALEPGGACNFLIMAERLGLKTAAMGCVGEDYFGALLREKLRAENVDCSALLSVPGKRTTLVMVMIDDLGEHAFLGAMGDVMITAPAPEFVQKIKSSAALYTNGYAFLESSPAELVIELMKIARQNEKLIIFDPGPQIRQINPGLIRDAIALTDDLLLTQAEAETIVEANHPEDIADELLSLGPRTVVLKKGAAGCLIANNTQRLYVDAFPVDVRDTTGSGDAFDAAFSYGMMRGMPLEDIGNLANAAGGCVASRIGAGTGLPLRAEIEEFLNQNQARPGSWIADK
jgi:sugar/nucleoside kinase (ribokinase family)